MNMYHILYSYSFLKLCVSTYAHMKYEILQTGEDYSKSVNPHVYSVLLLHILGCLCVV